MISNIDLEDKMQRNSRFIIAQLNFDVEGDHGWP